MKINVKVNTLAAPRDSNPANNQLSTVVTRVLDLEGAPPEVMLVPDFDDADLAFGCIVKMEDGTFKGILIPYLWVDQITRSDKFQTYLKEATSPQISSITGNTSDNLFPDNTVQEMIGSSWDVALSSTITKGNVYFDAIKKAVQDISLAIARNEDLDFTLSMKSDYKATLDQQNYKNTKASYKVSDIVARNPSVGTSLPFLVDPTQPISINKNAATTGFNYLTNTGSSLTIFEDAVTLTNAGASVGNIRTELETILAKLQDEQGKLAAEYETSL